MIAQMTPVRLMTRKSELRNFDVIGTSEAYGICDETGNSIVKQVET